MVHRHVQCHVCWHVHRHAYAHTYAHFYTPSQTCIIDMYDRYITNRFRDNLDELLPVVYRGFDDPEQKAKPCVDTHVYTPFQVLNDVWHRH